MLIYLNRRNSYRNNFPSLILSGGCYSPFEGETGQKHEQVRELLDMGEDWVKRAFPGEISEKTRTSASGG